jgi:transcriptional regulator with XRE-family HTH domain
MNIELKEISDIIRHIRYRSGLSQKAFAKRLKVSPVSIHSYESKKRKPRMAFYQKLVDAFPDHEQQIMSTLEDIKDSVDVYNKDVEKGVDMPGINSKYISLLEDKINLQEKELKELKGSEIQNKENPNTKGLDNKIIMPNPNHIPHIDVHSHKWELLDYDWYIESTVKINLFKKEVLHTFIKFDHVENFTGLIGMEKDDFFNNYLCIGKSFNIAKEEHPVNQIMVEESNKLLRERQNIFLTIYSMLRQVTSQNWYDDVPLVFKNPKTGVKVYTMNSTQLDYKTMTVKSKCKTIEEISALPIC